MAVTSIWSIKGWIGKVINYAENPDKTKEQTSQELISESETGQLQGLNDVITYAVNGNVIWMIAVPAAASNVLGSYFGSGMALKKGAAFIRPMILIVMILLMLKIVSDFVL